MSSHNNGKLGFLELLLLSSIGEYVLHNTQSSVPRIQLYKFCPPQPPEIHLATATEWVPAHYHKLMVNNIANP